MSKNEDQDKLVGNLTSFYEMLASENRKDRFDKILIPKIQRDYAQGRIGRETMRGRFLRRLFNAIDDLDGKNIKLDFVYGQAKNDVFLPIDGQQRLTTLFLLHLYLGKRVGADLSVFKNFTYDTRDSSKEFCLALIDIPNKEFRGIKEYITEQWWFTSRWSSDPTISSMLVMLDDIDRHYRDFPFETLKDTWKRLTKLNHIQFWNLKLDDLNTSDDLYIKMNSRGEPLTSFEHFKAEIEGYMYDSNDEERKLRASEFSLKIDTVWTALLWTYRNKDADSDPNKYSDNGLDSMFINIFKHFMVIEGTKSDGKYKELESTHVLDLADKILKGDADSLLQRFTRIMDFFAGLSDVRTFFNDVLTHGCDEYRIKEGYEPIPSNYRVYLQQRLDGTRDFLSRALKNSKLDIAEMLMLEAFFQYAYRNFDENLDSINNLRDKIRIIRNLILNSRDELRAERMSALLKRIDKIMEGEPLDESASGEFRQAQVAQEIKKNKYFTYHPDEEWLVKFAENHSILCGNLSCYMNEEGEVLTDLLHKHESLFHAEADYDKIERFLLTFGDYAPNVRGRKLYGGRDWQNWRDDIFTNGNKTLTPIIHKALNSMTSFDDQSLDSAIDKYLERHKSTHEFTWPYYMVKHKGTRHGDWARYAMATDFVMYDFIMMNKNNFNGKHWNPFLYCLFVKFKDRGAELSDYNAPLIFEDEEITVYCNESNYDVVMKDGSHCLLEIPQEKMDGYKVDSVDRIDWAYDKINAILYGSTNRDE